MTETGPLCELGAVVSGPDSRPAAEYDPEPTLGHVVATTHRMRGCRRRATAPRPRTTAGRRDRIRAWQDRRAGSSNGCRRIPNSADQLRLDVRRATPATLTGVTGRPTTASAVGMRLCTPGIESRSPISNPPMIMMAVISNTLDRLKIVIEHPP